jgi:transporter family-2 protein
MWQTGMVMDSMRYLLWAGLAGAFIPVMAIVNGRLGRHLGEPLYAATILFAIALVACLICAWFLTDAPLVWSAFQSTTPMLYIGGFIVGFYVISATMLAPRIGVANFIMMAVSSQLILSVIIDHWGLFGADVRPVTWARLSGVALLIIGVIVIQLNQSKPIDP